MRTFNIQEINFKPVEENKITSSAPCLPFKQLLHSYEIFSANKTIDRMPKMKK